MASPNLGKGLALATAAALPLLGLLGLLLAAVPAHAAPSFMGLGVGVHAHDVSADGSTVVGSRDTPSGIEAYRWTAAGGVVGLGDLPGGSFRSVAWGSSGDGSAVVGEGSGPMFFHSIRWTASGGMVALRNPAGALISGQAIDASEDGSVIVGLDGISAYRWTAATGAVPLGDLPGGIASSYARAVSADGSVITGGGTSAAGREVYRWTPSGGMQALGDLPGGSVDGNPTAISRDGSVIVGYGSTTGNADHAFRWTEGSGMVDLGVLPGSFTNPASSGARGVSDDGSIVVGTATSPTSSEAFIWDQANGMRQLDEVLRQLGVDLGDWTLTGAVGISADGRTIVGNGSHGGSTAQEAWIAVIPEPSTGLLFGAGLVVLAAGRRRRRQRARLTPTVHLRRWTPRRFRFAPRAFSPCA